MSGGGVCDCDGRTTEAEPIKMAPPGDSSKTIPVVVVHRESTDDYSLYGEQEEVWSVHVRPSDGNDAGTWELVVLPVTKLKALGESVRGCIRTDRGFSVLHQALSACQAHATFSAPLPHLPSLSTLLSSDSSIKERKGRTTAAELQEYMAALTQHPEVPALPVFLEFIDGVKAAAGGISQPPSGQILTPTVVRQKTEAAPASPELSRQASGAAPPPASRVTLSWTDEAGEHSIEMPILHPKHGMGNRVIDVGALASKAGFFTHDPGFTSTSSCVSAITYIDGEAGVLLHRGYPIEQLARTCSYPEVAYLLVEGELPDTAELATFEAELKAHQMVHEKLKDFYQGFKSDAHPMAIMVGVVGALSAFYPDSMDIMQPAARRVSAMRLVAKMPTIAAIS
jgi:hypothetical protein